MITEEERVLRRNGLGGSDIAIVFGLSKYCTPFQLWEDKALGHFRPAHEDEDSMLMRADAEEVVAKYYKRREGNTVKSMPGMKFSDKAPWLFANIDYMAYTPTGTKKILEIKTVREFALSQYGEDGSEDMPVPYLLQVAHYCMIYEIEEADLICCWGFGPENTRIFHYKRNRKLEQTIFQQTREFWFNHVMTKEPPEYTIRDDLDILYGCIPGKTIEADNNLYDLYKEYNTLNKQLKACKERTEEIKGLFKLAMKDSEAITYEGGKIVKASQYEKATLDTKQIKAAYPQIFEQHKKLNKIKRLTIREIKDDE